MRAASMLARLERLSDRIPRRLKAALNLFISLALVLTATPFLWTGAHGAWADLSLGLGLALLAVFNLFT